MVGEQIDLVDVQQPAVRLREQTGVELGAAGAEGLREVHRAGDAVVARTDRKFDEARRASLSGDGRVSADRVRAVRAVRRGLGGVAREAAPGDDVHPRQDADETTHDRGLRGALLTPDENAADGGGDGRQDEGGGQVVGADDGGEGKTGHQFASWQVTTLAARGAPTPDDASGRGDVLAYPVGDHSGGTAAGFAPAFLARDGPIMTDADAARGPGGA